MNFEHRWFFIDNTSAGMLFRYQSCRKLLSGRCVLEAHGRNQLALSVFLSIFK